MGACASKENQNVFNQKPINNVNIPYQNPAFGQ